MHLKSNNFYNHLLRIQESFEHMQGMNFLGNQWKLTSHGLGTK